ncbi:MAG: GDSL-type esterase/lipase family protein [Clostridium sp.]|nr:GDSL-type esterase/lipase family protein [Clostridium sp.]
MENRKRKLTIYLLFLLGGICLCGPGAGTNHVCAADAGSNGEVSTEETEKLKTPEFTGCTATANGKIKLVWSKVKHADQYEVFRSESKRGEYVRIGITTKTAFTDRRGRKLKTYYYKVKAVKENRFTEENEYSEYSRAVKKKVRRTARRTAYAGDSVMKGFTSYGVISPNKKTRFFAKVGIHLHTFCDGDMLKQLLKYNPDRLFIMLGMNGLVGSPGDADLNTKVDYFRKIIRACLKKNPDMEIVVLGVSPVGRRASVKKDTVERFNKKLKRLVNSMDGVRYYDTWQILADSQGYLKSQYGGGDGIHWQKSGYEKIKKSLDAFIREY